MNNPRKTGIFLFVILVLVAASTGTASAQSYIPTPPPGTIILPPTPGGGSVDTPVGTIDVPQNPYNLVYTPLGSVPCPPPVGCLVFNPFNLDAYSGVDLVSPAYFDPPMEICMSYSDTEAESLGGVENLTIAYYDPNQNQWVSLSNIRIDTANKKICGDLTVLLQSECGIALTCALSPIGVPVTGRAPAGSASNSPVWLTLLVAVVLTSYLWMRRRQELG